MPNEYDEEMIEKLRLYGRVTKVDEYSKVMIHIIGGSSVGDRQLIGHPSGLHATIGIWMQHAVKNIETGK